MNGPPSLRCMFDILEWVDIVEGYAGGEVTDEALDQTTGNLFDNWPPTRLWYVVSIAVR